MPSSRYVEAVRTMTLFLTSSRRIFCDLDVFAILQGEFDGAFQSERNSGCTGWNRRRFLGAGRHRQSDKHNDNDIDAFTEESRVRAVVKPFCHASILFAALTSKATALRSSG